MNSPRLHSIVIFSHDIEQAASEHAKLFDAQSEKRDGFISMPLGKLILGFHPADERSRSGSAVPYFATDNIAQTIANAEEAGYTVYRGPITVGDERVVQLRNERDTRIGYVQKR